MKNEAVLCVSYNQHGIPVIETEKDCSLTYQCLADGELQIKGNATRLKLLSKALLALAEYEGDPSFHIHIDDLYNINNDNKTFTVCLAPEEPSCQN